MRYLVTGATGFLGARVCEALEARGHHVARFSRSAGGDVVDSRQVARAAAGCDGAFHCAGFVSRRDSDAAELYRVHVEGTRAVLDACASAAVGRVVIASTSGTVAVGEDPRRLATETDAAPVGIIGRWPYYRAKLFAEQAALARNGADLEVVCVNPSLLLGPGDRRGSSTGDVRDFLDRRVAAVPSGGISFVDVRDAADAMCAAMHLGRPGERYLVGACNLTVRELFERLARISKVPAPWLTLPRAPALVRESAVWMGRVASSFGLPKTMDPVSAEMASFFWYLDDTKAKKELGFCPRDPNRTLLDTVADLRERGVVWPPDPAGRAGDASACPS